uniref:PDZ domain-containing protein n=1 Tax=Syphacia muris TaxID=451379 RepID=A0A0N5AAW2_9BILA
MTHLGLNDISLTQMPQDIGKLRCLRSLEVRENLLRTIPTSISQLSQLQRLDLGHNELDDLPEQIGLLTSLQELYVDQNDLESLPDSIVQCKNLQQIDVSENKLRELPSEIGELDQLVDLTVSQNCLESLPNSIGRLKKLTILKADRNGLTQLTPAIGACTTLNELYLTENFLSTIPSSIGNLKALQTLNIDKNHLKELPATIGGCVALTVLSLRENFLENLPLDIGRLGNLHVLDVCSNRLNFLPYTISVLLNLKALWLSENQSQSTLKLQPEQDPHTGMKVLTCYLLPQSNSQAGSMYCEHIYAFLIQIGNYLRTIGFFVVERSPNRAAFTGGPKVHFGSDLEETVEEGDENQLAIGQFSRQDTPHPKPHSHAPKFKKQSIDGHIIHHEEDNIHPPTLTLSSSGRKRSSDESPVRSSPEVPPNAAASIPRSALKHPPALPPAIPTTSDQSLPIDKYDNVKPSCLPGVETLKVEIHRDANGGLGLSIAGGLESTCYKGDDSGLFVSKLAEGGPAQRAGLRVGRQAVTNVVNVRHQVRLLFFDFYDAICLIALIVAVTSMQNACDVVVITVLRDTLDNGLVAAPTTTMSPNHSLDASFVSEEASFSKETISTTFRRDINGSPGFSVAGGKSVNADTPIVISSIIPGGAVDKDGKLRVGDRILSINGTNMRGARHDQAVALLTGHSSSEVYLIVQRDHGFSNLFGVSSAPTSSVTGISGTKPPVIQSPRNSPSKSCGFGDSSWDGRTEDVELIREENSLGLSIVGGSDHSSHPFGVNAPGVFISKISANSPAARSQRLRIGDRILEVNGIDVRNARHQTTVEALKQSGPTVRLKVTHETQPAGLKEVVLRRNVGEPLGLNICGGINSPPANPLDKTDEGIFIEKVESHGPAAATSLLPGMRILEVNDESLLGCSQEEAAKILRRSGTIVRLLVCDAFTFTVSSFSVYLTPCLSAVDSNTMDNAAESSPKATLNEQVSSNLPVQKPISSGQVNGVQDVSYNPTLDDGPLATSSPVPPHTIYVFCIISLCVQQVPSTSAAGSAHTSSSSLYMNNNRPAPPPVAPKPRAISQISHTANPEKLGFSSKLQKFEQEIEEKRPIMSSTKIPVLPVDTL